MSHGCRQFIVVLAFCAMSFLDSSVLAKFPASLDVMREDATLHDLFFLDPDRGWAVGDRGVVWVTSNGGRTWNRQDVNVDCPLHSVYFADDNHGWIAGGWIEPHTHRTNGVILRTVDGGRHWTSLRNLTLPTLHKIQFSGPLSGWAIGNASPLHPAGIFVTKDGGRSWASVANGHGKHWQTGYMAGESHGVVASATGDVGLVTSGGLLEIETGLPANFKPRYAHMLAPTSGLLVGEAAMIARTDDAGRSWKPVHIPGATDDAIQQWNTVHSQGTNIWVAGSPGTRIIHSPDAGRSWQALRSPVSAGIKALHFIDESRGWAVGELGTILVTRNGGQAWQVQQQAAKQTAVLAVFADPHSVPLISLAQVCGNDGRLAACLFPLQATEGNPSAMQAADRTRMYDAVLSLGVSNIESSGQFPLLPGTLRPGTDELVKHWNKAHNGLAVRRLEERLVRAIRQYRPEVILTEGTTNDIDRPERLILNQLVLSAAKRSRDAEAYRSHITSLGLQPWSPAKIYAATDVERPGSVATYANQLAPHLGVTLSDYTSYARSLLHETFSPSAEQVRLELLTSTNGTIGQHSHLFGGIPQLRLAGTQRHLASVNNMSMTELGKTVQRRRNLQQLLIRMEDNAARQAAVLGQLYELTTDLSNDNAGDVIFEFSQRLNLTGQHELAAASLRHLLKRYPQHRNAEAAILWLVRYYGSDEVAWQHRESIAAKPTVIPAAAIERFDDGVPLPPKSKVWNQANTESAAGKRLDRVSKYQSLVKQTRPAFFSDPRLRFPFASAQRRTKEETLSQAYFRHAQASSGHPTWRRLASYELWFAEPNGKPPASTWECRSVDQRPYLDAKFDEAFWATADTIELDTLAQNSKSPSALKIARDDKFLYLAITCRKAEEFTYHETEETRPRDPDLSKEDRVTISLDVDRDAATAYQFAFDHRGWVHDQCWHDASWNPTFYVADVSEPHYWAIEVAIPLDQLVPRAPGRDDAWYVSARRIVPGVEQQSWRSEAALSNSLDNFGCLLFK